MRVVRTKRSVAMIPTKKIEIVWNAYSNFRKETDFLLEKIRKPSDINAGYNLANGDAKRPALKCSDNE